MSDILSDIYCPYCGYGQDVDIYYDLDFNVTDCGQCGKDFVFSAKEIIRDNKVIESLYYPKKADCLNGGTHNSFGVIDIDKDYPKINHVRCSVCGTESHEGVDQVAVDKYELERLAAYKKKYGIDIFEQKMKSLVLLTGSALYCAGYKAGLWGEQAQQDQPEEYYRGHKEGFINR